MVFRSQEFHVRQIVLRIERFGSVARRAQSKQSKSDKLQLARTQCRKFIR